MTNPIEIVKNFSMPFAKYIIRIFVLYGAN